MYDPSNPCGLDLCLSSPQDNSWRESCGPLEHCLLRPALLAKWVNGMKPCNLAIVSVDARGRSCKVHKTLMTNPIVGQCMLYVAQMAYAAYVMIFKRVLNEKVPCMCLAGLLWVYLHLC